jgi:hypothetical protein
VPISNGVANFVKFISILPNVRFAILLFEDGRSGCSVFPMANANIAPPRAEGRRDSGSAVFSATPAAAAGGETQQVSFPINTKPFSRVALSSH